MRIVQLLSLLILGALAALPATDSVSVIATNPNANEQGLVPGKVLFSRTGANAALTVYYRITGTAVSDLAGGYVSSVQLSNTGTDYRTAYIASTGITGSGTGNSATVSAQGGGGKITGVTMTANGSGYDQATPPAVTITDTAASATVTGGQGATGTAVLRGYVVGTTITAGGAGYNSGTFNNQSIFTGGGGSGATADVTVTGGVVTAISIVNGGSGYISEPSIVLPAGTFGAGTTAFAGTVTLSWNVANITISSAGSGYINPRITIDVPPNGTRATAQATVAGSDISSVTLLTSGSGYALPTASVAGGVGAVLRPVVSNGAVWSVVIENGGSGYANTTPVTITGGTVAATATATAINGVIVAVSVTSGGSGYGGTAVTITDPAGRVTSTTCTPSPWDPSDDAQVTATIASPDFTAPAGAALSNGNLDGSITFAVGEYTKELSITPQRNGVPGGRDLTVQILQYQPSLGQNAYTVNSQSTAQITIGDADEQASITVPRPVAYPVPPIQDAGLLPIEVQGRGEWRVDLSRADGLSIDDRLRRTSFEIQADTSIGALAVNGTDYLMCWNNKAIASTAGDYVLAMNAELVAPFNTGPAKVGATTIPVASVIQNRTVICFENPTDLLNGIYVVTGSSAATDTANATITITPALKRINCIAGATRLRILGQTWAAATPQMGRLDWYHDDPAVYFFAFPYHSTTARARRSIALNFLQTDDYRVLSPTVGSLTVADDAVSTGLRFGSNAGKPTTNGYAEVVLTSAFPVDVDVPFQVLDHVNAGLGTDFTVTGVDTSTGRGTVRVSAGSTTARIEIQPTATVIAADRTISLLLLPSPDYQLAPAGTSPVNPQVAITMTKAPTTTAGEDVYIAIAKGIDGAEPTTPATFSVTLANASGATLTGTLTTSLAVSYTISGSATAGVNYQTPSGSVIIPAGSKSATVPITVIDDQRVTADMSLVVTVASGPGYQVSSLSSTTLALLDASPRVRVAATTATATRGGTNGVFTLTNTRVVNRDTVVHYTVGGTAVAGTDYTALAGTVTIPSGQSTATVQVAALASAAGNASASTVILTLVTDSATSPTYVVDTPSSDTVTVPAATPAGLVTNANESIYYAVAAVTNAQKPSTNGTFRFSLASSTGAALVGTATAPLSVTYIVGGTAVAGTAYTALSGTAIIPNGGRYVDVNVVPINNGTTGTTTVTATIPTGLTTSSASAATVSILDAGGTTPTPTPNTTTAEQFRSMPLAAGGGGGGKGCGVGSGIGLVGLGGGLVLMLALRRRRRG